MTEKKIVPKFINQKIDKNNFLLSLVQVTKTIQKLLDFPQSLNNKHIINIIFG